MCRIEIDGAMVAILGPGVLIGEMTYHTGEPATATVVVDAPARILAFERTGLEGFLQRNDDIRVTLEQSVAGDLAASSPTRPAPSPWTGGAPAPRRDVKPRGVPASR